MIILSYDYKTPPFLLFFSFMLKFQDKAACAWLQPQHSPEAAWSGAFKRTRDGLGCPTSGIPHHTGAKYICIFCPDSDSVL